MTDAPLIAVTDAVVEFRQQGFLRRGPGIRAVAGVSIAVARGETVGVVGESGSGKSTLGRAMLGLQPLSSGALTFDGQDAVRFGRSARKAMRRRAQLVFQDPYGSLDSRRRVGAQIGDGLAIHDVLPRSARAARVAKLLTTVGLDPAHAERYPHEFSGGQRQRIGIARAIAAGPEFLVADEPVSALDVSIQAQILELFQRLKQELGLAMLFISHDLPVVRHIADRVVVMYLGRLMEEGRAADIFAQPAHPYTRALLSATPRLKGGKGPRIVLPGEPPSPSAPPSGCVFRTRCPHARPICAGAVPLLAEIGPDHRAACVRLNEIAKERTSP
jgi:oligopeptide/dipeptide ABC transporter ATP-binding protein